jgi:hypothetical protein
MSAIRGGADFRISDKREVGSVNRSKRLCPSLRVCPNSRGTGWTAGVVYTVSTCGARVVCG